MENKEGWSGNITKKGAKTHYYKDGISLCKRAFQEKFMKHFDKDKIGSKYFKDCVSCIKINNAQNKKL